MTKAMRKVTGSLKVDLAQFRAMEAFAMFASDLDPASRQQLARGERLMELLKQGQYAPYPTEEQVVSMWLGTSGRLDIVPTQDVRRFEREFIDYLKREQGGMLDGIRESQTFDDDTDSVMAGAYDSFLTQFETSEGEQIRPGREDVEAMADEDIENEKIVRQKRG
jgi:F-type H+-transporting ATPase subunit alpha